jgi:hypothetical protein
MAVAPNPRWLTLALAFLNPYDDAPVIAALKKTLAMPTGMAWFGVVFGQVSQIPRT